MKLGLVQYVMSLNMADDNKKDELIKAVLDRDDWEIIPWGYMDNQKHPIVDVRTRDGAYTLNSIPVGYLSKDELLEAIERLQDEIEDMKIDERIQEEE